MLPNAEPDTLPSTASVQYSVIFYVIIVSVTYRYLFTLLRDPQNSSSFEQLAATLFNVLDSWAEMAPFIPRQRKHRVRQRLNHHDKKSETELDPNAIEIVPPSKREREEKRKALRAEIRGQQQNISSKKQKRLDKYIVKLQF